MNGPSMRTYVPRRRTPVIDADGHAVEDHDAIVARLDPAVRPLAPQFEVYPSGAAQLVAIEGREFTPAFGTGEPPALSSKRRSIGRAGTDVAARVAVLDSEGIDLSVIFPSLGLYYGLYESAEVAAAVCRASNDWVIEWCDQAPHRLAAMAVLPQQDPELAVTELRRSVQDGAVGGMVRPNPSAGHRLDEPAYDVLWNAATELDVPIVFHEGWVGGGFDTVGLTRARTYAAGHAMSHTFEQMAAMLAMAQCGALSRFPALRLGFFEAGCGWVPYWYDRIREHAEMRPAEFPDGVVSLDRRVWVTFEPGDQQVEAAAAAGWSGNICFASDFPHLDATYPGAVEIARAGKLDPDLEDRLLGQNALALFGERLERRLRPALRDAARLPRQPTTEFLLRHLAGGTAHSGATLVDHLTATAELLRAWGARAALVDAGAFHSVYGTEAFTTAIVDDGSRADVREMIGAEAEELAWLFSRISSDTLIASITRGSALADRESGARLDVTPAQVDDLCELSVANWLEQRPRMPLATQHDLLGAAQLLRERLSLAAADSVALITELTPDELAMRNWVGHSQRFIRIGRSADRDGGERSTLEPDTVLGHSDALAALSSLASHLRAQQSDNTRVDDALQQAALRMPVDLRQLGDALGGDAVAALERVGALERGAGTDTVTLAFGLATFGRDVVVSPADRDRLDGVYFGLEPLLLDALVRAVLQAHQTEVGHHPILRALDLGCGAGLSAVLAARHANHVVAVDVNHRASSFLSITRRINPHLRPRVTPMTADAAATLVPASFGLVTSNPPLAPSGTAAPKAVYSDGGWSGTELPIRLLRAGAEALAPGGLLAMVTLDSTLHGGRRPLLEALADRDGLGPHYEQFVLESPWKVWMPRHLPRILSEHSATLADTRHVGIALVRTDGSGEGTAAARAVVGRAVAALAGAGWTA